MQCAAYRVLHTKIKNNKKSHAQKPNPYYKKTESSNIQEERKSSCHEKENCETFVYHYFYDHFGHYDTELLSANQNRAIEYGAKRQSRD